MRITFSKFQGTGNDFIIIDNRRLNLQPGAGLVAALCDRHFGIGADGLMLMEEREGYDFGMTYFNSDGKESTMCGNGGRCMMAFARSSGMEVDRFRFLAIDGEHEGEVRRGTADLYRLRMKDVDTVERFDDGIRLDTGSPHFVAVVGDVSQVDVQGKGRMLRHDPRFAPGGTNVDFLEPGSGRIIVRTYERGVEGETLSCGTGVTAAAIVYSMISNDPRQPVTISTPGGELSVSFRRSGLRFTDIWLEGPAKLVFSGEAEV